MSLSQKSGAPAPARESGAGLGRAAELRRLVIAHQQGDEEAFPALVRMTFPAMYRHAHRRLIDPRAAEDAVQDALLRAYRALPALRGEYQVAAWLHRIVANVCADEGNRRRREAVVNERLSAHPDTPAPSADEATESAEVTRMVSSAIGTLPSNYREALVLRDILELEYADVATRAGITEDNARARVHRARAALRRLVDSSFVLGGTLVGGLRRIGRASVETVQHAGTAASTTASNVAVTVTTLPPEVVAAPARMSVAAASITAAAVAAAAAVPVFTVAGPTMSNRPTNQSGAPAVRVISSDPSTSTPTSVVRVATASALGRWTPLIVADPTTSSSTTSTTPSSTSTTMPVTTTTSAAAGQSSPSQPGAYPSSTSVLAGSGGAAAEPIDIRVAGSLRLSGGGIDPSTGQTQSTDMAGTVQLRPGPNAVSAGGMLDNYTPDACGSAFSLRLAWTDAQGLDHAYLLHGWAQNDPNQPNLWSLAGTFRDDGPSATANPAERSLSGSLFFDADGTRANIKVVLGEAPPDPGISCAPQPAAPASPGPG